MIEKTDSEPYIRDDGNGTIVLAIYVQPKASRNRLLGVHGEELKLAITAPPVDGKANKAVIAFLARFFKLSKADVVITSGHQSRHKQCQLAHITLEAARLKLQGIM